MSLSKLLHSRHMTLAQPNQYLFHQRQILIHLSRSEQPIQAFPHREISKIVDLAKELPSEDIFVFIVQRADGRYEEYRISATYSGDVMELHADSFRRQDNHWLST